MILQRTTSSATHPAVVSLLALIPACSQAADSSKPQRGAYKMPYIRYEADKGTLGGNAEVRGPSYDQDRAEAEASERMYVALPVRGAFVEWRIRGAIDGVVVRFTMPDSSDGTGRRGKLTLYINGKRARDIPLSSNHAWQYFDKTRTPRHPHNDPARARGVGSARMRFDEVRFKLNARTRNTDRVRLQKDQYDGIEYGIDFIEVEAVPPVLPRPDGYLDVTTVGVRAVRGHDNYDALTRAINARGNTRKGLYIPPGRYEVGGRLDVRNDMERIAGAGVWHTELYFTDAKAGGIYGTASRTRVSGLHLSSVLNKRDGYRAFGQHWGSGSIIENCWIEHFSVGLWVAYYGPGKQRVADNLVVRNCRIRNTYADGLNFAKGSRNCVLEHSNIRNTGDDAMATWSSNIETVGPTSGNTFRHNTVEHALRAGGLGVFGGAKHRAHDCVIVDCFAGPGIRLNSVFPGHAFGADELIEITDMTVKRCGTRNNMFGQLLGAIDLEVKRYDVRNIRFRSIDIVDALTSGIVVHSLRNKPSYSIRDVSFDRIRIDGTGLDGDGDGHGILAHRDVAGWVECGAIEYTNIRDEKVVVGSGDFEVRR